jgi:replication factor A1
VTGTRRWIFSGRCDDESGSRYVSFFDDMATKLLGGKSADELGPLKEHNSVAFDGHFRQHSFQRVLMKCQVKSDTYNDEQRLKVSCQAFAPLNVIDEGNKLLHEIRQLLA